MTKKPRRNKLREIEEEVRAYHRRLECRANTGDFLNYALVTAIENILDIHWGDEERKKLDRENKKA